MMATRETDNGEVTPIGETLCLLGRTPLTAFLQYARNHATDPLSEDALVERWHTAARRLERIQLDEAGAADHPGLRRLTPEEEPLVREFLKDPLLRNGFETVPTEVALVELDRLVVHQEQIDVTFTHQLERRLGPSPTSAEVFRTCLPFDHPQPPVTWSRVYHDRYVFLSPSNDLRYLGALSMGSANLVDCPPIGNLVGVVGVAAGFGSNFLNAVYAEGRLLLGNGSHRAYTLRRMGITHVPCVVQHVSSREQLTAVAPSAVRDRPALYFEHVRPPMLRDYLNPQLHTVMKVHRRLRQVTIRFEVEEAYVPAV